MGSATGAGPTRLENPLNFFTPSFRQQSLLLY